VTHPAMPVVEEDLAAGGHVITMGPRTGGGNPPWRHADPCGMRVSRR
jgi:hypothetical protein